MQTETTEEVRMKVLHAAAILGTALTMGGAGARATFGGAPEDAGAGKGAEVTVIGCVMFEKDYRKLHNDGKGGVLGTGIGEAGEFVLVDASSPKNVDKSPVVTTASKTATYALTGKLEKNFAENVNRQVEVVGTLRPGKASAAREAAPRRRSRK
jgi:hypothetical protein